MSVTLTLIPAASVWVMAGMPASVPGILMKAFGAIDEPGECLRLRYGPVGVVGELGIHLDGHAAVHSGRGVERWAHDVAGPADVIRRDHARGLVDCDAAQSEVAHLFGIVVGVGECLGEDRRVRGHADDVVVPAQFVEATRGEPFP